MVGLHFLLSTQLNRISFILDLVLNSNDRGMFFTAIKARYHFVFGIVRRLQEKLRLFNHWMRSFKLMRRIATGLSGSGSGSSLAPDGALAANRCIVKAVSPLR